MQQAILFALYVAGAVAIYLGVLALSRHFSGGSAKQKQRMQEDLNQMFMFNMSVDRLQKLKNWLSGTMAVLGLILTWEAAQPAPFIAALIFGIVGYFSPELYIARLRKKRREKFADQLVDALVLMGNALRSNMNLSQAINLVTEEMPAPISQEFNLVKKRVEFGNTEVEALRECAERVKDQDLAIVVTAISITQEMGGNLPWVFERIVTIVRDRKILFGKADALTSEGKMQAMVVGVLPYIFAFFMIKVNPDLMQIMWTTLPGFLCLLLVIFLDTVGYLWVRKLASIEY